LRDPGISDLGKKQCLDFRKSRAGRKMIDNIDHIAYSHMLKTLETTMLVFEKLLDSCPELKVIALSNLQNLDPGACGTGMDADILTSYSSRAWGYKVDTSRVFGGWNVKISPWNYR
ncbi:hypothetical protein B0J14DRAFT_468109, partial [Halenospora varia]